MKLLNLRAELDKHPEATLRFVLPDGEMVPAHAHVTEVARIDKRFIDCGGTFRADSHCRLQTWFSDDTEHRLTAGKLSKILALAAPVLGSDDLEVDVENEVGFISQFPLASVTVLESELVLNLTQRHTACLAPEKCTPSTRSISDFNPLEFNPRSTRPASSCCTPRNTQSMKRKVLFVCIHNSARSQMAEAFLKQLCGTEFEVHSAGIEPGKLNPIVVEAMKEVGMDISANSTKSVSGFLKSGSTFSHVITVCDESSAERCPTFPGATARLHWGFPDPSALQGTQEEKLAKTREVRDAIKRRIEAWCWENCPVSKC